ncbi:MAG: hypothetical protein GY938_04140 [Ketobacter sp.]|nr:hypothetical protein [Ketobacter sp.]
MLENLDLTMFDMLAEPFPPESVHWRVGSTNKRKWERDNSIQKKGLPLAYVDARDVMDRLDFVCGPQNWQCKYTNPGNGSSCCDIGIRVNDEWIWKANGAGHTQVEGDKGQYSDAFKRAAVCWGIGRYLYDCDAWWVELDDYWHIKKETKKDLSNGPLAKASQGQTWGDRNVANMTRLLLGAIEVGCQTADDVQRFLDMKQGTLEQLRVGPKRKIQAKLQEIVDAYEAKVAV